MSRILFALLLLCAVNFAGAWPLDGYPDTGIRRVEGSRLANEGLVNDIRQPPGALLPTSAVQLRLRDYPDLAIPAPDPDFTAEVLGLLGDEVDRYALALLDLTDPNAPVYAEYRGDAAQNVGSVGKVIAALGLFQALAETWPDPVQRQQVLRDTALVADDFSQSDHHTIRLFDVAQRTLQRRPMQIGDTGSLWEYLDWTLSVSSNSAAAMVQRDAMMMRALGRGYPPAPAAVDGFFRERSRAELTRLYQQTFWDPVTANGMSLGAFRQGSFFTRGGKRRVDGGGDSYATPRGLLDFALKMEQGKLVDPWSSLQLKRLLYVTERRIRYASAPELKNAAVYFKTGSLYRCKAEEGFECHPYHGNVYNYMNALAIVEEPVEGAAGERQLHYIAVLLSNVLRRNGAVDHQRVGGAIHEMLRRRHQPHESLVSAAAQAGAAPGH
ncbi:hypothetical protein FV139_01695 [Parahaliea maris]|uniref:Serine hydrolase n=1 Tax=Parahaliea maris TaxID=2716870 RepID=A0A5C9A9B9_9GAMM|nr:serine hydrolase [Parahaliea maris]TXS96240.1 hypothetical protein FV139_01695 [Parahaliea maris]